MPRKILVTGADGFVGRHLCAALAQRGARIRRCARTHTADEDISVTGELTSATSWEDLLDDIDVVIHLAARARADSPRRENSYAGLYQVNCAATLNLARQAAAAGVKRFIFLSSVKVLGEQTPAGAPFKEDDSPAPQDDYARSKLEAETGLREIARQTGMDIVIIRSPLVYGSGVKGNFAALIKLTRMRVPLPFRGVDNRRSLVGTGNLVDFICTCIEHPAAASHTFLVSDDDDISTPELLSRLAQAQGRKVRLFYLPSRIMLRGAELVGKKSVAQRVLGSLQVDISKAKKVLGWKAPFSMREELTRCFSAPSSPNEIPPPSVFRALDVIFSLGGMIVCSPLLAIIFVLGWFDTGSPLFKQQRVGKGGIPFVLIKFRTMEIDTASVPSHMAASARITRLGKLLRRTKLDELPQLWNVLKGEMSLVGPRPGLFNQQELTAAREVRGVLGVRPGITGLSQIRGIDMSTPELLATTDRQMLEHLTVADYFYYIFKTIGGQGRGDRIR